MSSAKTTRTVSFRLTVEQRAIIEERAEASGQTVAQFIKSAVLSAAPTYAPRRKATPVPGLPELKKFVTDVERVGANMNKLAKAAYRLRKYLAAGEDGRLSPQVAERLHQLAFEVIHAYDGEVAARTALDEAAALLRDEARRRAEAPQ